MKSTKVAPGEVVGSAQGDRPTGILTSPTFTVPRGALSFLVGGGSAFTTRVELRVLNQIEGPIQVESASGQNTESMRRVQWDLSQHVGKQAQIRIVDDASGAWGHINADDFRFSALDSTVPSLMVALSGKPCRFCAAWACISGRSPVQRCKRQIVRQTPPAQQQVLRGTAIDVVAESPPTPDLIGRKMREALPILSDANLRFGVIRGSPTPRRRLSLRARPRASQVPNGAINITLERIKRVPELRGSKKDDALAKWSL